MADSDPYRHLGTINGCVTSWWFKGCITPLIGIVILWIYIAVNGPP
jgi:hypothetical protein